jgi:hypothetical protein
VIGLPPTRLCSAACRACRTPSASRAQGNGGETPRAAPGTRDAVGQHGQPVGEVAGVGDEHDQRVVELGGEQGLTGVGGGVGRHVDGRRALPGASEYRQHADRPGGQLLAQRRHGRCHRRLLPGQQHPQERRPQRRRRTVQRPRLLQPQGQEQCGSVDDVPIGRRERPGPPDGQETARAWAVAE